MTAGTERISDNGANHVVQFYNDDRELVEQVGRYLAEGIEEGEMVFVVATAAHRLAFDRSLRARGVDVVAARANGCYVVLDAEDTMRHILIDNRPDPVGFESTVGALIRRAQASGRPVRGYGEIVALLWDQGQVNAAIELEALWNALGGTLTFSLFCAYPTRVVVRDDHLDSFAEVCRLHTAVVGTPAASVTRAEPVDIYQDMWITIV